MFVDGRTLNGELLEADMCIVGGGAAGIALSHQFLNTGTTVVMIESGGLNPDAAAQALNEGETSGIPTDLESSRLRFFGGSTNHWEGMCAPLQAIDFERRPWVQYSGWPFGIEVMNPYYRRASEFLNMSGNASADFSAPQDIFDHHGDLAFNLWRVPERLRLGQAYRGALKKADNLRVILHATVTNIKTTADAGRVTAMEASTFEKQRFTIRAKRYVLAAGGIENARLLLLSRDTIPAGLGNQRDLVGRFFMQHPHAEVGRLYSFGSIAPFQLFTPHMNTGKITLNQPISYNITPSDAAMRRYSLLNSSLAILNIQQCRDWNPVPPAVNWMRTVFKKERDMLYHMSLYMRSAQIPNPDSRVMLSDKAKDAFGLPVTHLHWQLTEKDWQSIRHVTLLLSKSVAAQKSGVIRLLPWLQRDTQWPSDLEGGSHHMGTTRMNDDAASGVVNRNCRLHDTDNLYIAGSSVYPTAGWANPTYTLIALAIRLADHLKALA